MFEDLDDFLSYGVDRLNEIQNRINESEAAIRDINKSISSLRNTLDSIDDDAFYYAYRMINDQGREIFLERMNNAVVETKEFDYQPFRDRLYRVVENQNLITVDRHSNGGTIFINMEQVAGSIQDYIEGIEFARTVLNVGKMPPQAASKVWAEKIYGVDREGNSVTKKTKKGSKDVTQRYKGKYQKTIEARLSKLSSLAPFWYIIEYGTGVFEGRGGYETPRFGGTRFVEKTRVELQAMFDDLYSSYLSRELTYYDSEMDKLLSLRSRMGSEIENLYRLLTIAVESGFDDSGRGKAGLSEVDIAMQVVEDYLRQERGIADEVSYHHKLAVAERLVEGDLTRTSLGFTSVRLVNLHKEFLQKLEEYIRGE